MADLITTTTANMSTTHSRSNSMATTAFTSTSSSPPPPPQPSRISSEAPEVVPSQPQPPQQTAPREDFSNGVPVSTYSEVDIKRSGGGSRHQKQVDTRETETRNYPLSPRVYDWEPTPVTPTPRKLDVCEEEPYKAAERRIGRRRTFGLVTTVALVVVAFLLGGGIGGGVGGALLAQEKSKTPSPTSTTSSAPATATVILDQAGCPLVNNSTYLSPSTATTPVTAFLKLCGTEIASPAGQSLDLANSTQPSFDACLDSCAGYRGCVGATWVLFSPGSPGRNSVCFLKSGVGVLGKSPEGGTSCSGYLKAAVG